MEISNGYHQQKTTKVQTSMLVFVDNFEQHFESCFLNTKNPFKRALNKISCLITPKNEVTKFSVVPGFSNMLYGKKQKPGNAGNQQKAF